MSTAHDWPGMTEALDAQGFAVLTQLLSPQACADTAALYGDDAPFRKQVIMARHGYGSGDYKYFAYALPPLVESLRATLYRRLVPVANCWQSALGAAEEYPAEHAAFLARCHAAGQTKPTPLLLRYGQGDFNCLHQDLYGAHVFPLQVAILLSAPGADFIGGEFVLTEQRPRMQSRAHVVPLNQGDAVVFAVHHRPVRGTRGTYRTIMRHGVGTVRSGHRQTLGIIFHDAA
jgi:hypothetical protein